MLKRVMLPTISLTTLVVVATWPLAATALIRPLSASNPASVQLSNSVLNHDPFVEHPSDDLSGLMLTGCSQMGSGGPQVCLQWLGDALTTCLEWGNESVVTACMQRGNAPGEGAEEDYDSNSTGHHSSRNDWGFSLGFTLQ